jgi:hypothetical protein
MRFALSRLLALTVMAAYVVLIYVTFRAHSPALLVTTIFIGAIVMHLATKGVYEWGEGRPFDAPRLVGFLFAAVLIGLSVAAYLRLRR